MWRAVCVRLTAPVQAMTAVSRAREVAGRVVGSDRFIKLRRPPAFDVKIIGSRCMPSPPARGAGLMTSLMPTSMGDVALQIDELHLDPTPWVAHSPRPAIPKCSLYRRGTDRR
jgi:hypothetical protein